MLIPADRLVQLLAATERTLHTGGWNNPALLAYVTYTPKGLRATRLPMEFLRPITTFLEFMAETVEDEPELVPRSTVLGSLEALMFAHESWSHPASREEQWELTDQGAIDLSEIPGSFQVRQLILIDLHGQIIVLHRVHGQEPRYGARSAAEWHYPHGITHSLARIVRAIARHTSPLLCDFDALNLLVANAEDPETERRLSEPEL